MENRKNILGLLDRMNAKMPEMRKIEAETLQIRAEIATLNAKLSASDSSMSDAEFARAVRGALDSW